MSEAPQYIIDRQNWVACMKIHGKKIWRAVGQYRLGAARMGRRRVLKRKDLKNKSAAVRYRKDFEERYERLLRVYVFPTSGTQVEQTRAPEAEQTRGEQTRALKAGGKVRARGSLTVEAAGDG